MNNAQWEKKDNSQVFNQNLTFVYIPPSPPPKKKKNYISLLATRKSISYRISLKMENGCSVLWLTFIADV